MDATTTRASTVMRSMPTREMRTQASITIPLSRTRSSTSIRLDPPDTRSTAIDSLLWRFQINLTFSPPRYAGFSSGHANIPARNSGPSLSRSFCNLVYAGEYRRLHGQVWIVFPPVHPDLLGFVYRAHQQTDSDREQLNIRQRNAHVARDYEYFIENAIQDIYQIRSSRGCWHPFHGLRFLSAGKTT